MLLNPAHSTLSIRKQCKLLELNRSNVYYKPTGETEDNLKYMRLLDEQYTATPFYGVPRMTVCVAKGMRSIQRGLDD